MDFDCYGESLSSWWKFYRSHFPMQKLLNELGDAVDSIQWTSKRAAPESPFVSSGLVCLIYYSRLRHTKGRQGEWKRNERVGRCHKKDKKA